MSVTPSFAIDNVKKSPIPIISGNTLYVGGTGPGNYTTIQDALNSANKGDTVFVFDESSPYYENIWINSSIALIGENRNTTIIDGNGLDDVVFLRGNGAKITGFTIQNGGSEYGYSEYGGMAGILIRGDHNIVTGNIIKDNHLNGIEIQGGGNIISNNVIKNNEKFGIYISFYCYGSLISDNIFEDYDSIFFGEGNFCDRYKIINNTANGKPIRCYVNKEDVVIPDDASQVILINCNNCTIQNVDSSGLDIGILIVGDSSNNHIFDCTIIDNTWAGVWIFSSYGINNNISNNIIADNYIGVYIMDSEYNTIFGNIIDGNEIGIRIRPISTPSDISTKQDYQPLSHPNINTNILKNNITKNRWGINLYISYYNNIFLNNITKNEYGIYIETLYSSSSHNNIYLNNIISNIEGISIWTCNNNIYQNNFMYNWMGVLIGFSFTGGVHNNKIYHNNFIKNRHNGLVCNPDKNNWDDGSEGNYWDNYRGRDWDGDGIGERPFRILPFFIKNKDKYPLMEPYADVPDVIIKEVNNIPRTRTSSYFERFPLLERLLGLLL